MVLIFAIINCNGDTIGFNKCNIAIIACNKLSYLKFLLRGSWCMPIKTLSLGVAVGPSSLEFASYGCIAACIFWANAPLKRKKPMKSMLADCNQWWQMTKTPCYICIPPFPIMDIISGWDLQLVHIFHIIYVVTRKGKGWSRVSFFWGWVHLMPTLKPSKLSL